MTEPEDIEEQSRRGQIEDLHKAIRTAERAKAFAPFVVMGIAFLSMWQGGAFEVRALAATAVPAFFVLSGLAVEAYNIRIALLKMELRECLRGELT